MAIMGRPAILKAGEFISLQQVASNPVHLTATPKKTVRDYLFPNTLSGLLISITLVFVLVGAFNLLRGVQTPTYYPTEKMDFGKIEK